MHVAHVLRKLDPAAWGGVETHVHALAAALRARDVGGTLFAPRRGPEDEAPGGAPVERYRALLPVLGPAERRRALWAVGGNLISLDLPLRLARDARFALAHAHTQRRVGGAVRVAMRHTGRPYVVSIHGPLLSAPAWVAEESARRRGRSLDVGQPWGALVGARRVLRDADRVIVFNRAEEAAVEGRRREPRVAGVDLPEEDVAQRLAVGGAGAARLEEGQHRVGEVADVPPQVGRAAVRDVDEPRRAGVPSDRAVVGLERRLRRVRPLPRDRAVAAPRVETQRGAVPPHRRRRAPPRCLRRVAGERANRRRSVLIAAPPHLLPHFGLVGRRRRRPPRRHILHLCGGAQQLDVAREERRRRQRLRRVLEPRVPLRRRRAAVSRAVRAAGMGSG